jgi:hypothetical protein
MTLEEIAGRMAGVTTRPKTLLLTAIDGVGTRAETIEKAGGTPCHALTDSPDVLILALPGSSLDDAEEEALALAETPGWWDLPCVTGGDSYLVDAEQLTGEAQATWILATILHPDIFTEMLPPYSVRMLPKELYKKDDTDG